VMRLLSSSPLKRNKSFSADWRRTPTRFGPGLNFRIPNDFMTVPKQRVLSESACCTTSGDISFSNCTISLRFCWPFFPWPSRRRESRTACHIDVVTWISSKSCLYAWTFSRRLSNVSLPLMNLFIAAGCCNLPRTAEKCRGRVAGRETGHGRQNRKITLCANIVQTICINHPPF
jgi:hypothetical protein